MGIGPTVPFYWSNTPVPPVPRRPKPWLEYIPATVGIVALALIILLSYSWGHI